MQNESKQLAWRVYIVPTDKKTFFKDLTTQLKQNKAARGKYSANR